MRPQVVSLWGKMGPDEQQWKEAGGEERQYFKLNRNILIYLQICSLVRQLDVILANYVIRWNSDPVSALWRVRYSTNNFEMVWRVLQRLKHRRRKGREDNNEWSERWLDDVIGLQREERSHRENREMNGEIDGEEERRSDKRDEGKLCFP